MIEGTTIKNGSLKIILEGTDDIDIAILKKLDGAICRIVTDNFRIHDRNISGCLMIEAQSDHSALNRLPEPKIEPEIEPDEDRED